MWIKAKKPSEVSLPVLSLILNGKVPKRKKDLYELIGIKLYTEK